MQNMPPETYAEILRETRNNALREVIVMIADMKDSIYDMQGSRIKSPAIATLDSLRNQINNNIITK